MTSFKNKGTILVAIQFIINVVVCMNFKEATPNDLKNI